MSKIQSSKEGADEIRRIIEEDSPLVLTPWAIFLKGTLENTPKPKDGKYDPQKDAAKFALLYPKEAGVAVLLLMEIQSILTGGVILRLRKKK